MAISLRLAASNVLIGLGLEGVASGIAGLYGQAVAEAKEYVVDKGS